MRSVQHIQHTVSWFSQTCVYQVQYLALRTTGTRTMWTNLVVRSSFPLPMDLLDLTRVGYYAYTGVPIPETSSCGTSICACVGR